jgi:hypothetical protein
VNESELMNSFDGLGLEDDERNEVIPALAAFAAWTAAPTSDDTSNLVRRLRPLMPTGRRVRTARHVRTGISGEFGYLIRVALSQVTVLRAGFWFGSLVVLAISAALAATQGDGARSVVLYLAGPLLAYMGTSAGFRAESLGVLEFEFACPITPRQLTVARLLIIVGYQTTAGMVIAFAFAPVIGGPALQLVAMWLAPLLLGAGVTLLCSLRFPIAWAGATVYAGWIALVVLAWRFGSIASATSLPAEIAFAAIGLAAIGVAVWWLPAAMPVLLSRRQLRFA